MNFKNFLSNDKQLQESHFLGDTQSVILGYGSFSPFHIGYLPMIAEMMKLSDEHNAEAILTIMRTPSTNETMLNTVIETLSRDYSFLKVVVERDVASSLMKLHSFSRVPVAVLGETVIVEKALVTCKAVYGKDTLVKYVPAYLDSVQQVCERAVANNDLTSFRSHLMYTDNKQVTTTFDLLKEAHGQ
jgi:hypothetical protein